MSWFAGQWWDGDFFQLAWFQEESGVIPPVQPEWVGGAGWIGIPKTVQQWLELPKRIFRKRKKPAAPVTLQAAAAAAVEPPIFVPPAPPEEVAQDFARWVRQVARERKRSERLALLQAVNRLRKQLGMPRWEIAIAFPDGMRYRYLSKYQLQLRMLREELARLKAMRKRAA